MDAVPEKAETPREVEWRDITEFDRLDERVSAVSALFGSVVGVNGGYVEWCTDSLPPAESERLAWLWLCWPNLDEQLMARARPDHRGLMRAYRSGRLREWWSKIGGSLPK